MLSEIVTSSFEPKPRPLTKGITGSAIKPCAYANYIAFHKLDPGEDSSKGQMTMEDGHWQERKAISHFRRAGIKVKNVTPDQMTVHFGRARIIGHPDGIVETDRERMLEVKAMNSFRFSRFSEGFLEPGIRCQTQAYLFSDELYHRVNEVVIYAICKETAEPVDFVFERDEDFIKPIIEVVDAIVLDGYEPPKEINDFCPYCYHQEFCWGTLIRDLSTPKLVSLKEAVDTWTKGKALKSAGEELIDLSKPLIERALGEDKKAIMEGTSYNIKVQRINSTVQAFSQEKFLREFGLENLKRVMDQRERSYIRIDAL